MKNNIAITTLAMAILTQTSMAEKIQSRIANPRMAQIQSPAAASRAINRFPMPATHRAAMPAALPKGSSRIFPSVIGRQPIAPAPVVHKPLQRKIPTAVTSGTIKPRTNPGITRNLVGGKGFVGRNLAAKPQPSALAGIDAGKAESIRQGAALANGLKDVNRLRPEGLGSDLPDGLKLPSGNRSNNQQPADPFAENNNYNRKPKTPDHMASNTGGNGLTDIRGGRDNSRKGTPASYSDLTPTTRRVTDSSSGLVFGHGSSSTASGPVEVRQDEESGEYVATQTGTDSNGNQARVDVIQNTDDNGRVTGSTEIVTRSDGESASQRTIVRDSTGAIISDKTEKTTPGTRACDRSTGDVAMGGPVGPGAAAITGLVPLDLLRQPSGNESSGGTNLMTSGRLSRNHVNPGTRNDMSPGPGVKRNNIAPDGGLAGPTSGGSAGGNDLPD